MMPASATVQASRAAVTGVGPIGIVAGNLDRAIEFFCDVLAFELAAPTAEIGGGRGRRALLRLGDEALELTEYAPPVGRPVPHDARSNDGWFQHVAIVVSDMAEAYDRLRERGVRHISTRPQRLPDWNPNAGGIEAFYFQDADGHPLELLRFPADKGAAKWRDGGDRLFLGIDHTAIVVADTACSVEFYRGALGLAIGGASENHGSEQEELSGVRGARVRITNLRATRGPGIELLEYRVPRTGRPYPGDTRPNDLWHWQTTLFTPGADAAARTLRAAGARFLSPESVPAAPGEPGLRRGILMRDPDGHALEIIAS
jgi:catechol 2,3-dioxygenase-like lactoylglutathione lyase family enzyme